MTRKFFWYYRIFHPINPITFPPQWVSQGEEVCFGGRVLKMKGRILKKKKQKNNFLFDFYIKIYIKNQI